MKKDKNIVGEFLDIDSLHPHPKNPRHNDFAVDEIANSIKRFGFTSPIIAREEDGTIIAGHTRYKAAKKLGLSKVPVILVDLNPTDSELLMIADNKLGEKAEWNTEQLSELLIDLKAQGEDLDILGFDDHDLDELLNDLDSGNQEREIGRDRAGHLVETFGAPPFSVLDGKQGYWLQRKRFWLGLGIKSHLGRDAFADKSTCGMDWAVKYEGGGSIFDPVVAEVCYSWFNVPNGTILDPFAGGSVRGIIASALKYPYLGHELRSEQVEANRQQYIDIGTENEWFVEPKWILGDSAKTISKYEDEVDLVFSCPPYADLEVYSDDPADISNMEYSDFLIAYRKIIADSCARLKENRFAVFVIGEVRGKNGEYINFVSDTISAFIDAGMNYYNEIIYLTPLATVPLRAPKYMRTSRKVGKTHQNVLVFYKGDPSQASEFWKDIHIEIMEIEPDEE